MTRKTKSAPSITAASLPQQLGDLAKRRQNWELNEFSTSNNVLYGLLGECLDIYKATNGNRGLVGALNDYLRQVGLRTRANPSLQLRIVRAVFVQSNTDAKHDARLIGYAKVIKFAADNACSGATMAKFITDNNGIDAIRRRPANVTQAQMQTQIRITPQEYRETATQKLLQATTKTLLKNVPLPDQLQPLSDQTFSVALVRKEADGTGSVVFGINSVAAVNAVLHFVGRELEAETAAQSVTQTLAAEAADKQAALDAFKQMAAGSVIDDKLAAA